MTRIRQISGTFNSDQNISLQGLENQSSKLLIKLGIQSKENNVIILNGIEIQIGKTDRIEYEDIVFISLKLKEEGSIIIDYIYEEEEAQGV